MYNDNRSIAHHAPPVVVPNVGQQGPEPFKAQCMVGGSQTQIFLFSRWEEVGFVEGGQ